VIREALLSRSKIEILTLSTASFFTLEAKEKPILV
jgi:hypothetical protein